MEQSTALLDFLATYIPDPYVRSVVMGTILLCLMLGLLKIVSFGLFSNK